MSTTALDKMDLTLEGLAHALNDRYLAVPRYQRAYAWDEKHVRQLLEDIADAYNGNRLEYFLGTIVTGLRDDTSEVIDGQQRLATASILIASIRDFFLANGDVNRADDIERDFLLTRDRRTQETRPKLKLSDEDHEFYVRRILKRADDPLRVSATPSRYSHERIVGASTTTAAFVRGFANVSGTAADRLLGWLDYLEKKTKVIWVEVPDHANAFVVFETLNDRGVGLSAADLLKNYLFSLAGDRLPEIQERWVKMLGTLDVLADDDAAVSFMKHYWASVYGPVRARELFEKIKSKVNSKQGALDLATALAENAKLYVAILHATAEFWKSYGDTARGHVQTLNHLRMEQIRPLLLAILTSFSGDEVKASLRLMVSWSARFLIVGGLGGGTMESHYSDVAQKVRAAKFTTAKDLSKALANVVPADATFESSFAAARVSQHWLARYYLRALEVVKRGGPEPELVPNDNSEQLTLEHVLPENPSGNWTNVPDEVASAYYRRLGNMTLLPKRPNNDLQSKSFDEKKEVYKDSALEITKPILDQDKWDQATIEDRQKWLAAIAVKAWPI